MVHLNIRTFAAAGALALSVSVFAMGEPPQGRRGSRQQAHRSRGPRRAGGPGAAAAGGNRSGEQIYKAVCGACHETGVANAPKTGDKAAWAPRIALASTAC
jgi:cytochrome c5